jgi:MFS family permease
MLPLSLFRSRNFTVGNAATLLIYAALGAFFFFAVVFLQQVGEYSAFEAGLALMPVTVILFALSKRAGALADRYGPRLFMGLGPIIAGVGLLLAVRLDASADYATELFPAMLVFSVGLALTVAPLTATVLGAVEPGHSGLASGTNNAVARIAGLLAIAVVGAVVAGRFSAEVDERLPAERLSPPAATAVERARERPLVTTVRGVPAAERPRVRETLTDASVESFRVGTIVSAALALAGGLIALVGIENPRRKVRAEECPGGAICGASEDAGRAPRREPAHA